MPEGHTIHRAALDQRPMLADQRLKILSPQGRFAEGAARIDGQTCTGIEAFGKHLVYRFEGGDALHVHLGLFGMFRAAKLPARAPKGAVRVRMISRTHVVDINGPNTCEVLDGAGLAALTGRIGPDVLRKDADPDKAWTRISRSRSSIGLLLMDQSVIAGIGNIYRSEILWRQGIDPELPGNRIPPEAFDRIWTDAVHLLGIGVNANTIITVDGVKKSKSRYGERVNIFAKEICPACASAIKAFEIGGRRAFACGRCQTSA
ncbi:Fpg/Nei family DNA glycosylase [Aestuariivirga sp.]|uniref:Fpg/Nei family DNA glycosylase n=1 Tax=Aestuariivirga sp. TaxID=2650926 RepID=UPI003593AE5A